ncbi:hypothetical protein ABZ172_11970 [Streptomyces sp. NPDC006296]|uniref:hypothetical protein n=1 Tax=Streptomyces sp. NPDC006296 TaxID=3156746 RepID=UPI0033AE037A
MNTVDGRQRINHANCTHPSTGAAREKCRREHGLLSPSQVAREEARKREVAARKKAKAAVAAAPPKPQTTPGKPHPKARYDKSGWRAESRLTVPKMAHFIWKRMKYNRDGRYVFTREWVRQQYPGSDATMIDAALQYLVDTGKINTIPL